MKVWDRGGGVQGGTHFRWQEQENLEQRPRLSSDKQLLGRRWPLPCPTATWPKHKDCHSRLDLSGSPSSCLTHSGQIVLWGWVPHQTSICAQSMAHRGHSALVASPRAVYASFSVCPAAPALMESWSQPSPLCPAMEAEPACFWLPYMNH